MKQTFYNYLNLFIHSTNFHFIMNQIITNYKLIFTLKFFTKTHMNHELQLKNLKQYNLVLQASLQTIQNQRRVTQREYHNLEIMNNNMGLQIDSLVSQLKHLDSIIDDKNVQLQQKDCLILNLQQKLCPIQLEQLKQKNKIISDLQNKLIKFQQKQKIKSFQTAQIQQLKHINQQLKRQIEKLQQIQLKENEQWKLKIQQLKKVHQMEEQNKNNLLVEKLRQIIYLKQQILINEQQKSQIQLHSLNPQSQSPPSHQSPQDLIGQLSSKIQYLQTEILQLQVLNKQFKQLKEKYNQLVDKNKELQDQNNSLVDLLTEIQFNIQNVKHEMENMKEKQDKNKEYKVIIQTLKQQINNLTFNKSKLQKQHTQTNFSSEQLIHRLNQKNQQLQSKLEKLILFQIQHQDQAHNLKILVQNLTQQLKQKSRQLHDLRKQIKNKQQQINQKGNNLENFVSQIQQLTRIQQESQIYKRRLQHVQKQLQEQKKSVLDYQKTLFQSSIKLEEIKHNLQKKEFKQQGLERQLVRAKKYNEILLNQMKSYTGLNVNNNKGNENSQVNSQFLTNYYNHETLLQLKKLIEQEIKLIERQNKPYNLAKTKSLKLFKHTFSSSTKDQNLQNSFQQKFVNKTDVKQSQKNRYIKQNINHSFSAIQQTNNIDKPNSVSNLNYSNENPQKFKNVSKNKYLNGYLNKQLFSNQLNSLPSSLPSNVSQPKASLKKQIQIMQFSFSSSEANDQPKTLTCSSHFKKLQHCFEKRISTPFLQKYNQNNSSQKSLTQLKRNKLSTQQVQKSLYQKQQKILQKAKSEKQLQIQKILDQRKILLKQEKQKIVLIPPQPLIKKNVRIYNYDSSILDEPKNECFGTPFSREQLQHIFTTKLPINSENQIIEKLNIQEINWTPLMTFNKRRYK